MGTCANIKNCEICNTSEYNQTLDINFLCSVRENHPDTNKSIDLIINNEKSESWWSLIKLLESDKSWREED
jgi:L-rhamnose mutarotase